MLTKLSQWFINSGGFRRWFSTVMLIVLIAVFSLLSDRFATFENGRVILEQSVVLMVVALGATLVIIGGSIDLSVGSIVGISSVITAILVTTMGIWQAVLVAIMIGAILGTINGLVFAYGKIPSFIVTLGMLTAVRGVILGITEGSPTIIRDESFINLFSGRTFGISHGVMVAVIMFIITILVLERVAFGREVRAVGAGEKVAWLTGIRVNRAKVLMFMFSGLMAGVAGVLLAARARVGDATQGIGLELEVIAAVVIGGTPLTGGIGRAWGTIIGALTIGVLSNGLNILGVPSYWQQIITGFVLVVAVFLTIDRKKIGIIK
jgi:ribose transport system permease protein